MWKAIFHLFVWVVRIHNINLKKLTAVQNTVPKSIRNIQIITSRSVVLGVVNMISIAILHTGLLDVLTSFFCFNNAFIREDLPTLVLPMKAT